KVRRGAGEGVVELEVTATELARARALACRGRPPPPVVAPGHQASATVVTQSHTLPGPWAPTGQSHHPKAGAARDGGSRHMHRRSTHNHNPNSNSQPSPNPNPRFKD
ncbi:unnamed protein product, partial [Discosporangium mesarthrocarpum]